MKLDAQPYITIQILSVRGLQSVTMEVQSPDRKPSLKRWQSAAKEVQLGLQYTNRFEQLAGNYKYVHAH